MRRSATTSLLSVLGMAMLLPMLAGCHSAGDDLAEIKEQQRKILAKLDGLEKKVDEAGKRPARARPGPDPKRQYRLPVQDSPVRGPADAPVTIVEFSDYQCPFCGRAEPSIEAVLKDYPGKVRLVYKHFPLALIHPHALSAAYASAAAQKQGKFWEMHDLLFAHQRALAPEQLDSYAKQIGLDMDEFKKDMSSPEVKKVIAADMRLGQRVGIRGTPTFFVNGRVLQNRSVEGFKKAIDPVLEQQQAAG
jgi:protein-disulfide isomerase